MLKIELKRHTAVRNTAYGPVETYFNQDIVLVNGREAGYVGDHEGAKFLPLSGFPKAWNKEVDEFIATARNRPVVYSDPAPPVIDPSTGEVVS
jgi:hypothetical protein